MLLFMWGLLPYIRMQLKNIGKFFFLLMEDVKMNLGNVPADLVMVNCFNDLLKPLGMDFNTK